jgi:hypothetical protein
MITGGKTTRLVELDLRTGGEVDAFESDTGCTGPEGLKGSGMGLTAILGQAGKILGVDLEMPCKDMMNGKGAIKTFSSEYLLQSVYLLSRIYTVYCGSSLGHEVGYIL